MVGRDLSLEGFLGCGLLTPAVRKEGRLSSRTDHKSKSIAQRSCWCSIRSEDLKRLVELENMLKENQSSESLRLDFVVKVSNVSQDGDSLSKIGESSGVESFSFTCNDGVNIASSTVVGGENQWFSDQERNQGNEGLLKDWGLRIVVVEHIKGCLEGRFTRNGGTSSTASSSNIAICGKALTLSRRVGISELAISSLASLNSGTEDILELVNLELRDLLDGLSNQPLNRSTARRSGSRSNIRVETSRTSHSSVKITSVCGSVTSARVEGASCGASSGSDIRVFSKSCITFFTEDSINDSISAVWKLAVVSASGKRLSNCLIITLFIEILESITTSWDTACSLTSVGSVGIVGTKITFLASSDKSITTFKQTGAGTSIMINIVSIITTFLGSISHQRVEGSVSTVSEGTVSFARCCVQTIAGSKITFFIDIDDTITAVR